MAPEDVSAPASPVSSILSVAKRYVLVVGRPLIVIGLLIVILARGCDGVGRRAAAAAQARARSERSDFDYDCKTDQLKVDKKIREIQEKENQTDEDRKRIEELQKEREALVKKQDKERRDLQEGRWRRLENAAETAGAGNDISGASRESWFVFGTLLLVFGLLAVGSAAQGAERWLCLVVLAIVILSFYNAIIALGRGI